MKTIDEEVPILPILLKEGLASFLLRYKTELYPSVIFPKVGRDYYNNTMYKSTVINL